MSNVSHANDSAPPCAGPDPSPCSPQLRLPPLSCDSHAHVFGPAQRYPYSPARIYTPPDALPSTYRALLSTLGVQRAVLVQPSVYGNDNLALLDALALDPIHQRGVVVFEPNTSFTQLERWHALGVRGVRCNVVDVKEGQGALPIKHLQALADLIAPLKWHLELLMHVDAYPDLDERLGRLPVDLVFGHLGYMAPGSGVGAPGSKALLRLMQQGRAWVKLTGPYRISSAPLPYPDVTPLAQALVRAAPQQVVWGTDWPHVMLKGAMPGDAALCDLLTQWVPEGADLHRVLVSNPARLYGFSES